MDCILLRTYLNMRLQSLASFERHKDPNHVHGPDCMPPTEQVLIKFLETLSDEDFDKICFLQHLHKVGYNMRGMR